MASHRAQTVWLNSPPGLPLPLSAPSIGGEEDLGAAAQVAQHVGDVPLGRSRRVGEFGLAEPAHAGGQQVVAGAQRLDVPVGPLCHRRSPNSVMVVQVIAEAIMSPLSYSLRE
jgi:hypothetical protein